MVCLMGLSGWRGELVFVIGVWSAVWAGVGCNRWASYGSDQGFQFCSGG